MDLGYVGTVGALAVKAGLNSTGPTSARFYVTWSPDERPKDTEACSGDQRTLTPGAWTVSACNKEGR